MIAVGCESPLGPTDLSWRVAAYFPDFIYDDDACAAEDGIYIAGGPSLYLFDDRTSEFYEVYTSTNGYDTRFYAVDAYGDNIWLGGYRDTGGGTELPVVAYRTGGEWYENDLPGVGLSNWEVQGITAVPDEEPACYVFLVNEWDLSIRIALYRPTTGECTLVSELAGFNAPVRTGGGRIFSVKYDPTGSYFYVAVKDPGDTEFAIEKVPVSWGPFTLINRTSPAIRGKEWGCPVGEGLAVTLKLTWEEGIEDWYSAVVLRDDAPPGEGTYTLSFYSPWAPDFHEISTCAFKDRYNGCVLGSEVSTFMVNGEWVKETPSDYAEHLQNAVVLDGIYYAVGVQYNDKPALYRSYR